MVIARLVILATFCAAAACDDDRRTPGPSNTTASIRVESFTVTATPVSGAISYRIAFTLRETSGTAATLSDVTITAVTAAGSASRTFTAMQAFGTTRILGNSTLAATVTFEGPPVAASQVIVRVPYVDDRGVSGTAEGATTVTTGS